MNLRRVGCFLAERSVDHCHECALFAQDESLRLRRGKVCAAIRVGFQPRTVSLVSCQTVERDQAPCDVVGTLVRKKVADEMTAAAGNPRMLIANTTLPWTAEWLFFYELWLVTGEWDGGGHWPTGAGA